MHFTFDDDQAGFEPFDPLPIRDVPRPPPPPHPVDDIKDVPPPGPPPPPIATEGDDVIFLGYEDDEFDGLGGDDEIHGGPGMDFLMGGDGNDTIFGDGWIDILVGGAGVDEMWGGIEIDYFRFGEGDSGMGDQADRIMDYETDDYLDFKNIDGDKIVAGDQHFDWIGELGAGGEPGIAEIGFYFDGADTRLVVNNGDMFEIVLANTHEVPVGNIYNVDMGDGYGPLEFQPDGGNGPDGFVGAEQPDAAAAMLVFDFLATETPVISDIDGFLG